MSQEALSPPGDSHFGSCSVKASAMTAQKYDPQKIREMPSLKEDNLGPGQTPHAQVIPCLLLKHVSSGLPVLGRHHFVLLVQNFYLSASGVARSYLSTHRHAHPSSQAT